MSEEKVKNEVVGVWSVVRHIHKLGQGKAWNAADTRLSAAERWPRAVLLAVP